MSTITTQWITEFVDGISDPVNGVTEAAEAASEAIDGMNNSAQNANKEIKKLSAMDLKATADSIRDLTNQFEDFMQPGVEFEVQMKEMQAVTRLADEEMEKLGKSARQTAKIYGNEAARQLESYSSLVGRLGPAVAEDNVALSEMGENIAILSKSMKGDAVGAMDALTTAMLQFGVDLSNPQQAAVEMTRMMNVMAAAGNEGASEVADTAQALKNAGVAARNSNVSFEETNAALQALAQGGRIGAEAGVSLRNVLGKMGGIDIIPRKAQAKIHELGIDFDIVSDKSLSLSDRLRELQKAQGDATLLAQIFGIENEAAANILLNNVDAIEEMTAAITGTNAAMESAEIIMSSGAEARARFNAWIDNVKIGFYDIAGGILPVVVGLGTVAFTIANIASAVTGITQLVTFMKSLSIVTKISTAAQWLFNAALWANPITWIAGLIIGLVAAVVICWNKFEGFRKVILGVWEVAKGFGNILKTFVIDRIMGIVNGVGALGQAIGKLFKGDFKGAWQSANEAARGIIGIDAAKNAIDSARAFSVKDAYQDGEQKGAESWQASQDKKEQPSMGPLQSFQMGAAGLGNGEATGGTVVGSTATSSGGASKDGVRLSGSGSGGGKTINMTVNNYFSGFKGTREMAEEVAAAIHSRLSDNLAII